jgi:pimeloyl-ACP methyl ester carboxylesterase
MADPLDPVPGDVAARGAHIRFVEAGQGSPVLLVHDLFASHDVWDLILPRLATRLRAIALDLPGFGDSEKPPPRRFLYGLTAFAEALVDVAAALGLGRMAVCGHGLGAAVALTTAATHPHLVERLILIAPPVYPSRQDIYTRLVGIPGLGALLLKHIYGRRLFARHLEARSSPPFPHRIDRLYQAFNHPEAREAAYATLLATTDHRPLAASIPRITCPTLVVWGRGDRILPIDYGRRLTRELRSGRIEVFECSHAPHEELPDAFAQTISAFLGRRD